jgi:hypothetical protein
MKASMMFENAVYRVAKEVGGGLGGGGFAVLDSPKKTLAERKNLSFLECRYVFTFCFPSFYDNAKILI